MSLIDLFGAKVFTPGRITRLISHVLRHGIQLSNVMHMGGDPNGIAIVQNGNRLTYDELFKQAASVAGYLHHTYNIEQGDKVLVVLDNSIPSVVLLIALSSLGCNIHIAGSMRDDIDVSKFNFVFAGEQVKFWDDALGHDEYSPFVRVHTSISIFNSGSTGVAKGAGRSNTLLQYVRAIGDIFATLRLQDYSLLILPVPIYHSYGLSALFLGLMMNKTVFLVNKFKAEEVASVINDNNVEVAILIPQMIYRLTNYKLSSLRCIVSCADVLPVNVFEKARSNFGDVIFNLYGTSETGLATIATPSMLKERPDTIGRPVDGCKLEIKIEEGNPILYVRSGFAMKRGFLRTGDLAKVDTQGRYYLLGRADHLLVINGVNVYPDEILKMAYNNGSVQHAEMKSYKDEQGFKRIKLALRVKEGAQLDDAQFKNWWVEKYDTKFLPTIVEVLHDDNDIKLFL